MNSGAAELELDADIPHAHEHPAWTTLKRLFRHRLFLSGLGLFGIILLAAALAPWIAPVDPTKLAMRFKFRPPGSDFAFGTDNFGRSLWSRVIWGAQLSVIIGFSVVALNAVFGTLIGALAGYFKVLDNGLMRVNDAMMAFPAILLAIGITAVLGPSTLNAILALAIVYIPRTARIVRSSVIVLREMEYVQAAVAAGAGHWRILRRHILPNVMGPVLVIATIHLAIAIITEATLSFLGVGVPPTAPSLGTLIRIGNSYLFSGMWWISIFPGIALVALVLSVNLLGDWLRDALNPKLR